MINSILPNPYKIFIRNSFSLLTFFLIFSFSLLHAQTDSTFQSLQSYNTKKNFVFINGSLGGGDYPFAGLGLSLSHQLFKGNTMAGVSFQYIGTTSDGTWSGIDDIQIFPIMLDIRQRFMESKSGRFATFLIVSGGYVVSITGNDIDADGNSFQYNNGWGISPGIGFRFNIFENVGAMLDLTWFHHRHPREWLTPVEQTDYKHYDVGLVRLNIFF